MTLRHWQMEKVSGSAEPLLSTTGNKGLNSSGGSTIVYDSTALFGKYLNDAADYVGAVQARKRPFDEFDTLDRFDGQTFQCSCSNGRTRRSDAVDQYD